MNTAFLVCLASFLVAASGERRIFGGHDAADGTALYQASLRTTLNEHFCGGSVIHAHWILTAAHCTDGSTPASINVVVGTHTLKSGGTTYSVKEIIQHKSYDENLAMNDISLLRLNKDIAFGKLVQPIKLPSKNTKAGADLVLTGWGRTSVPGSAPNNLQTLNVTALSVEDCRKRYYNKDKYPVVSTEICTLTKDGEGVCNGDSGGPLVEGDRVVGVVSWAMLCARGYPDVYVRVYSYLDWIRQRIYEREPKNMWIKY